MGKVPNMWRSKDLQICSDNRRLFSKAFQFLIKIKVLIDKFEIYDNLSSSIIIQNFETLKFNFSYFNWFIMCLKRNVDKKN